MSNWKLIIEAYNELPEADRTSHKVYARLREQGHSISVNRVQDVLSATILSEMLNEEDVRVFVRMLNTVFDICSDEFRKSEPDSIDTEFTEGFTRPLMSLAGPSSSDLREAMLRLVSDCRRYREFVQEYDYIESRREPLNRSDENLMF